MVSYDAIHQHQLSNPQFRTLTSSDYCAIADTALLLCLPRLTVTHIRDVFECREVNFWTIYAVNLAVVTAAAQPHVVGAYLGLELLYRSIGRLKPGETGRTIGTVFVLTFYVHQIGLIPVPCHVLILIANAGGALARRRLNKAIAPKKVRREPDDGRVSFLDVWHLMANDAIYGPVDRESQG